MATKDTNYLVAVHKGLDESLEKQVAALPEKFNKQRFLQNCMTVLQDGQADFSKCEAPTVVRTLLKGAFLGLDFFNGECYAIPYGNQCQFQTDYKGEIKLCKRYSSNPIQDIYAKVVREGDEFEEVIDNGKQSVNFRPKAFNNGEIIGAFAVVLYKDGSMMYDTMSKEDIEHTRQTFSKAANSNGCVTESNVDVQKSNIEKELEKELEKENKKGGKRETTQSIFERLLPEYTISDVMADKLREWFKYKTERKDGYKEQGMKSLLKQVANKVSVYGDTAVCNLIDECMSNGWKGIIWDKLQSSSAYRNSGDRIGNRVKDVDGW